MSAFLYSLGRWTFRRRGIVLSAWLLVLALVAGGAALLFQGTDDEFTIPGTESQTAISSLSETFPEVSGAGAQIAIKAADGDTVEDDDYRSGIEAAIADLEDEDQVSGVSSPYSSDVEGTLSDDSTAAIIQIQMDGQLSEISDDRKDALTVHADELATQLPDGSQVALGGELFNIEVPGVSVAEIIGVAIALVVLIITFGSFVAAGFPLINAILAVGISVSLILATTALVPVSQTTPILALMLGLALGIDYSLFIISRYQDLIKRGTEPEEAAARSVATSGSAVIFAGMTVMIALVGLGVAQIPFLTTMGVAAAVAVAFAVAISLTLTPALLSFGGRFVISKRARRNTSEPKENRFFLGWVRAVTAKPIITIVAVVVTLGAAIIPAMSLQLALPDATDLSEDSPARQSAEIVADNFGPGFNGPLIVTATIVGSTDPIQLMDDLGDEIAALDGVESVPLATPNPTGDTGIVQVVPTTGPKAEETRALVAELRGLQDHFVDEYNVETSVTGFTALGIDVSSLLGSALVPFGIFVVGLSLILLTIVFRSLWVPLKATLGYLLSVVAAFGAVTAVFEFGVGSDFLNVAQLGPVVSFLPIVLMGVLFGLAMDYEVFLVSRIREEYVHGKSASEAVVHGFAGTAKVVTAAALIMFAVFAAFIPTGDSIIKPIALGLAVGVFVDAFIVRMTLVPAVLVLLGDRAWHLPKWLDRILPVFDVEGEQIQKELDLADWPEIRDGEPAPALVAEGVSVGADQPDGPVLEDFSAQVAPGGVLALGGEQRAVTAALLALSGRIAISDGKLKTVGYLSGPRSNAIRSRTAYVRVTDPALLADHIRAAAAEEPHVIVLDGIDAVVEEPFRSAVERALDDARSQAPSDHLLTIVTGSQDAGLAAEILPPAALVTVEVAAHTNASAHRQEVNA